MPPSEAGGAPQDRPSRVRPEAAPPEPLPVALVARLLRLLSRAEVVEPEAALVARVSDDLTRVPLHALKHTAEAQVVHFRPSGVKVIAPTAEAIGMLSKAAVFAQTAAIAGPGGEFLAVADGASLAVFRAGTEAQVGRRVLPTPILGIAVCASDTSRFAAWSLRRVYVLAVMADGSLGAPQEIHLMLEDVGPKLYVISASWVPAKPFHIAVTTPAFVKIYDVTLDCLSPMACFTSSEKVSESLFFLDRDEPYLAAVVGSTKVAVHACTVDPSRGPVSLSRYVTFGFPIDSVTLSYSPATRIVFLATSSALFLFRPEQLIARSVTEYNSIAMRSARHSAFVANHPTIPSVHILAGPGEAGISTVELLSDAIVASRVPPPPCVADAFPYFGAFPLRDSFAVITSDGQICVLQSGRPRGGPSLRYCPAPHDGPEDGEPFAVPPSFWAAATVDRSGFAIIDARGQSIPPKKLVFDVSPARIWLRLRSQSHAIVGVALGFRSHLRVRSVKVLNRRLSVATGPQKKLFVPLKPTEVRSGADLPIEIDFAGMIEIAELDVYKTAWTAQGPVVDWRSAASDLRTFADAPETMLSTDVEFIVASLSAAPFIANGPADDSAAVELLRLMYERPKLAPFCRRIVLKAFGSATNLERLWAQAIAEVCERGSLDSEMRDLFWRDFALLPLNERSVISPIVWKCRGEEPEMYAIIAGLTE
jgi:hypothetical protein